VARNFLAARTTFPLGDSGVPDCRQVNANARRMKLRFDTCEKAIMFLIIVDVFSYVNRAM
jgi:hypothetical protein